MNPYHPKRTPNTQGTLHRWDNETANCGMGAIAHLKGKRNYEILDYALTSVCNMTHRGAVDADGKTGDGSGILSQIPYPLFKKEVEKLGHTLAQDTDLAVGVFFLPENDNAAQSQIQSFSESTVTKRQIELLGWREVPIHPDALGKIALETQPKIYHLLLKKPTDWSSDHYERQLYLCRREIEREFEETQNLYIPTLSSKLISYKGLAMPAALREFYLDLQNSDFHTGITLYHQRFSTNTFPAWPLGQPFRNMCHNGEINTVRGNRNWMASREEFYQSEVWGDDVELLKNLLSHRESDSSSLDHALELLTLSGRSIEHAMCMLVPPAYRHDQDISKNLRAFYQYNHCFSEPWDGPAGLVFTDGTKICASLDRNGLRPSRFTLTEDGLLYIGSESGAVTLPDEKIIRRGRLGPGQMLSGNTETGELLFDREIKEKLAKKQPYAQWIDENSIELKKFVSNQSHVPTEDYDPTTLSRHQVTHGVTKEDLDMVFPPMIKGSQEAVFSMGDDIPLAPLSQYPRLLFTYFKQLFAQVTNPPIDPIREWAVMTLNAGLGRERNLLTETPEHARVLELESALLFEHELDSIKNRHEHGFQSIVIDTTWPAEDGAFGLKATLDKICAYAEKAVDDGVEIIILSDRKTSAERVPIPSVLATGAIHHHLIRKKKRLRCSLVIDTAEARDTHQIACLFGFGATAVCPYLGYATVRQVVANDHKNKLGHITPEQAMSNYRKALEKGLLKIMSKMGISVLNSYQGAQIFEALGIGKEVVEYAFTGVHSRIEGVGFSEIAEESLIRHRAAWSECELDENKLGKPSAADGSTSEARREEAKPFACKPLDLGDPGYNRFRKSGERHALTTEVIKNFHTFVKTNNAEDYQEYLKASLNNNPITIKDLLEFRTEKCTPVPLDEVEPAEKIVKRFTTAAMSLGALSPEAHATLAIAMNRIGGKSDSGEGGEDPNRFQEWPNGELARSAIKQVASGRFGVTAHYLVNCDELEIKMAQGAKPGEGGQLPGHKVNALIARLRNTQPGVQLISPPPHHDIYSIEDLSQLIHDLKEINPKAKITVKLVSETGVGTIAAGVAKACADNILISGHDGGTAASPLSSTKHAGLPWEMGLSETQQTLILNNLRSRVTLRTDGGLRNGRDIIIGALLGAEQFNFGTISMIAMGCVYVRKCHLNNCPVGIATTDPKWRAKFKGTPENVINFMMGVANEAREIMASLGFRTMDELIGHSELLAQREVPNHQKANTLDLSAILKKVGDENTPRICTQERNIGIHKPTLDLQILQDLTEEATTGERKTDGGAQASRLSSGASRSGESSPPDEVGNSNPEDPLTQTLKNLPDRAPFEKTYQVVNTDRNIGTRISGRIAELYGNHGLPDQSIKLTLLGSAGQSFGTFLCGGLHLTLIGEGNDYTAKGMSGGEIIVRPPHDISPHFIAAQNSIVGNTVLYGATGGRLFVNGCAGERFCVRNSGATAICEGTGDHGCEYMTNGLVAILGLTGKNFGAGMSGGTAYIYDIDGKFQSRLNSEMVIALPIKRQQDILELKNLIELHASKTDSPRAQEILENWQDTLPKLIRVIAKEKYDLEKAEEEHEAAAAKQ